MMFIHAVRFAAKASLIVSVSTFCSISWSGSQAQAQAHRGAEENLVPFVIPGDDGALTITSQAQLIRAPVADSFVRCQDGKFYAGQQRVKFWGVNLCFGANFPSHAAADKVAAHFAKLGINAVRFHHMDLLDTPDGIWRTLPNGRREFDRRQIDRLDYFLARLHEHGIYANLNLHVSRTLTEAEGFPQLQNGPWWSSSNKWVVYYDPQVQHELKEYSRKLLTHENPYRNNRRRVDDPGIAMLEMLNENYFSKQGIDLLAKLPKRYVDSFKEVWNRWLVEKYETTQGLQRAWYSTEEPLGEFLVPAATWSTGLDGWQLNLDPPALDFALKVSPPGEVTPAEPERFAIRLAATAASEQAHFQQLTYREFSLKQDHPYTLSFWVRADARRDFNFEVSTTQGGHWRPLGVFETATASPEWTKIERVFFPGESIDKEAYVAFSFGTDARPIEFAEVTLQQGAAQRPLPADQSLEQQNIDVPISGWPRTAHRDLAQFLIDTERKWLLELKQYLHQLGAKVPITASQENYHADGILAETVDYIDLHNYWHHPTFPAGRDFNPVDYRTGNDPMEAEPLRSSWPTNSLLTRTGWRYHGMPFTLSEWNHAEPSDINSGAVMMAAALGALQDWDGVFFFDYEDQHSQWFKDHYRGFFEMNSQPVKLATFTIAANIFLRGDLQPLNKRLDGTFSERLDGRLAFEYLVGINPQATQAESAKLPEEMRFETADKSLVWDATDPSQAHLSLNTAKTQGAWGLIANGQLELPQLSIDVGPVLRNYATVIVTSMDDRPLAESSSMI